MKIAMKNVIKKEFLGFAVALVLVGCASKEEPKIETISQIQAKTGVPVTTAVVGFGTVRRVEQSEGTFQGISETYLANGLGGTLGSIPVKVGQKVYKNGVVAKMIIDGGSPVDVAQSNYDYSSQVYNRAQKLQAEGAVSQEQVEGARVMYEDAKRNLGRAKVGVTITTPFTGTVLEIFQSVGSKIDEKTPIVKVADLRIMKVDMQINEQTIHLYKKGQKAFVVVKSDTLWGEIERTALAANGRSHSFRVTAHFKNPNRKIMPGSFKQIHVVTEEKDDALFIPIEVVNYSDGLAFVFVEKGGVAEKRFVSLGIRNGKFYEITDGIEQGESVVVTGVTAVKDGAKVLVVN